MAAVGKVLTRQLLDMVCGVEGEAHPALPGGEDVREAALHPQATVHRLFSFTEHLDFR